MTQRWKIEIVTETDIQYDIKSGPKNLVSDIARGSISVIQEKFQNNKDDCFFIVLTKVAKYTDHTTPGLYLYYSLIKRSN